MRGRGRSRKNGRAGTSLVILGSSGNLSTTKLLPAVTQLGDDHLLPDRFRVIGVDLNPPGKAPPWMTFIPGDLMSRQTYDRLREDLEGTKGSPDVNVLFYLATAPSLFGSIVENLRKSGLARRAPGWRRIAVEKPFGLDLRGSAELERKLAKAFGGRTFRVDHFLEKGGTVGMVHFRFADGRLERLWNSRYIDNVQIMADEDFGVEGRGRFYDSVGVIRDMVQSHLLLLLCLVSMERPRLRQGGGEVMARRRLLKAISPISSVDVVWGQYRGYGEVSGVQEESRTPTFTALKLNINNSRWRGVPFYIRTGKCLARNETEIVVVFKRRHRTQHPDLVRFVIDPDPRVIMRRAGLERTWSDPHLSRSYRNEYSRVIRGALKGYRRRFVDVGFNGLSWRLFDPLLRRYEDVGEGPEIYDRGSWGPIASDEFLSSCGRAWYDGRSKTLN